MSLWISVPESHTVSSHSMLRISCRIAFLVVLLLLLPAGVCAAAEYHVDNRNSGADDQGVCSAGKPCRTITAAVQRAQAGDTVLIHEGEYREALDLPRSGDSPDKPIRIAAADGEKVVVKGSDRVTGWQPAGNGVWKRPGWPVNSQQVFVDGAQLAQIGAASPFHTLVNNGHVFLPPIGDGPGDLVERSFFYDASSKTLYIRLAPGADPNAQLVEASVRPFVLIPRERSFIVLDGLEFAHSNLTSLGIYGSMVNAWGTGWLVSNCTFRQSDFSGLAVVGEEHRVERCRFLDNGNLGLTVLGTDEAHGWQPVPNRPPQDIVVADSEFRGNNTRGFDPTWQAGGVKASMSCNGLTLHALRVEDNNGPGIWIDVLSRNVVVQRSLARRNSVGVAVEIMDGALIRNNMILGNEFGIIVAASNDVFIRNNTLAGNGLGVLVQGLPRQEHNEMRRVSLRNNLFVASQGTDIVLQENESLGATGNTSDYNVFLRASGDPIVVLTDDASQSPTVSGLESIRAKTGLEENSRAAAKRLEKVLEPEALRPEPGDIALDAGTPDAAMGAVDYFGNPRSVPSAPGGKALPDAGAVEYQGG